MNFPAFNVHPQEQKLLRVGLLGRGSIAEQHIRFISEIGHAKVVGLADKEKACAQRLEEPYEIQNI